MDINFDDLKNRIFESFSQVKPPSIGKIAVDKDWDSKTINADFSPFLNNHVEPLLLEKHSKSLPALTPEAFVFFLKDYLIYSLEHPNTELTEHLIYRFSTVDADKDYWEERLLLFTHEQKSVISDFLFLLRDILPKNESVLREHLDKAIHFWSTSL